MGSKTDELILRTAKEIVAKFIETRTITPTTFEEHFRNIYETVEKTVRKQEPADTQNRQSPNNQTTDK